MIDDKLDKFREDFLDGKDAVPPENVGTLINPKWARTGEGERLLSSIRKVDGITRAHKLMIPDTAQLVDFDAGGSELILSCINRTRGRVVMVHLRMRNPAESTYFFYEDEMQSDHIRYCQPPLMVPSLDSSRIKPDLVVSNPFNWNIDQLYHGVNKFLLILTRLGIHKALGFCPTFEEEYTPLLELTNPEWAKHFKGYIENGRYY